MPEPFKNFFNPKMIRQMGDHFERVEHSFNGDEFVRIATNGLDDLELKERSNQIVEALKVAMPADFRSACEIMVASLHPDIDDEVITRDMNERGVLGWAIMPMADFVALRGIGEFDFSMEVLAEFTKRSSSEFAVRTFFILDTDRALVHAMKWASDSCAHVRRLASEGSRPRLPWGKQLTMFVEDPLPLLPLLESLKDDPSEYVRRSVANNLNDIAKDHPEVVSGIAEKWMKGASVDRVRLVRHACRTLIKQGHKPTLKALGYGKPVIQVESIQVSTPSVKLGENLEFSIELSSCAKRTQSLIIDYVIHHRKANGTTTPKVFKWKNLELGAGAKRSFTKRHGIKKITTRVYYSGTHELEIQINGESFGCVSFEFEL